MMTQQASKVDTLPRGLIVNSLNQEELRCIVRFLETASYQRRGISIQYLEDTNRGFRRCTLAPTMSAKCNPKYPQLDIERFKPGVGKQLVHLIYWRHENNGML